MWLFNQLTLCEEPFVYSELEIWPKYFVIECLFNNISITLEKPIDTWNFQIIPENCPHENKKVNIY